MRGRAYFGLFLYNRDHAVSRERERESLEKRRENRVSTLGGGQLGGRQFAGVSFHGSHNEGHSRSSGVGAV